MAERTLAARCVKCGKLPHSQDSIYGEEIRLHNRTMKGQWCCTVCGNLKGEIKSIDDKKEKKKKK